MAGYHNHNWGWNVVGVRGSHYVMLLALVNESGGKGLVEKIRMGTLARRCNVSEERARGLTRDLVAWGLIQREKREHPVTKRQLANAYRLNRERMFPQEQGPQAGHVLGWKIWSAILEELTRTRNAQDTYLLRSQIREAYFDQSERPTATQQRRGVLYCVASTDVVNECFRDNGKWLHKLSDTCSPYLVEHFQLVHRVQVPEE